MDHKPLTRALLAVMSFALLQPSLGGDALDSWHRRDAGAEGIGLRSVGYGNGGFLVVGANGFIATSPDGVTWQRHESGTTNNLAFVSYGNSLFVAAGYGEAWTREKTLLTSSDGTNWQSVPFPESQTTLLSGLSYANGQFFLIVRLSAMNFWAPGFFTSATGADWRRVGFFDDATLRDLAYGNGHYVSVGSGAVEDWGMGTPYVHTSTNGMTWDNVPFDFRWWALNLRFTGVAHGKGLFVAVAEAPGPIGYVAYSTDGAAWSLVPKVYIKLNSVAFGGGIFCAVGDAGTLLTSRNGTEWDERVPGGITAFVDVAYGDGTFVAVGGDGSIIQSDPLVSLSLVQPSPPELSVAGPIGRTCQVQVCDPISSMTEWATLAEVTLTNNPTRWLDGVSSNRPQQFYRAVLQP